MSEHTETAARLQQILHECARKMERLHDWAERSTADRQSYTHAHKAGEFTAHYHTAYFVIGVAHSAGLDLDHTVLDRALERGDFL